MDLLISIKPNFIEKIISHEKKYEFRKRIFRKNVDKIFIYSSSPEKKIIGYFTAGDIVKDNPERLWDNFSHVAGISKETFFDVIEINMCEPTKNFFIKRKKYWTELGNSLKPNYNINIEMIKEDFLRRLETENDGMYGE